jgi:hypothetical protein
MTKKKITSLPATPFTIDDRKVYDNRDDSGLCPKPNDDLEGCKYPLKKMSMVSYIAKGEAKNRPGAMLQTANGTQKDRGQNPGQQGNWDPMSAWSEDEDWSGGNLTGI